jgi:hypothetical protein
MDTLRFGASVSAAVSAGPIGKEWTGRTLSVWLRALPSFSDSSKGRKRKKEDVVVSLFYYALKLWRDRMIAHLHFRLVRVPCKWTGHGKTKRERKGKSDAKLNVYLFFFWGGGRRLGRHAREWEDRHISATYVNTYLVEGSDAIFLSARSISALI